MHGGQQETTKSNQEVTVTQTRVVTAQVGRHGQMLEILGAKASSLAEEIHTGIKRKRLKGIGLSTGRMSLPPKGTRDGAPDTAAG